FSLLCITERTRNDMHENTSLDVISFEKGATADQAKPPNELLVIELTIRDIDVTRILVDTGSSDDIIFKSTLRKMKVSTSEISEEPILLVGFSEETTMTIDSIKQAVKARSVSKTMEFLVVDRPTSY